MFFGVQTLPYYQKHVFHKHMLLQLATVWYFYIQFYLHQKYVLNLKLSPMYPLYSE